MRIEVELNNDYIKRHLQNKEAFADMVCTKYDMLDKDLLVDFICAMLDVMSEEEFNQKVVPLLKKDFSDRV